MYGGGPKRTFRSRSQMSAFRGNVLQNSLPHGDSATIESDWTSRRINIARFRLILNQCCARYPLKIVLQQIQGVKRTAADPTVNVVQLTNERRFMWSWNAPVPLFQASQAPLLFRPPAALAEVM